MLSRFTRESKKTGIDSTDLELGREVGQKIDDLQGVRHLARYEIDASGGRATLVGHVRSRQMARSMAEVARRVRGVTAVEDRLFADDELEVRVAATIGRGDGQRGSRLVVRSEFGRLRIGGAFASSAAAADAIEIGRSVPGVVDATAARATDLLS
ncbi:MAG: BON domain-containing protein [Chloroflexota bacterium]|nr:MAG: BON domain-containing protein [Chloroflexota bacterium]